MIGALDIALVTGLHGPAWRLAPTPGAGTGWLVGRTAGEAARLLPHVFNLCAGAHEAAARAALGLPLMDNPARTRRERVREHALAILADWPALFGRTPDRAALRHLGGQGGAEGLRTALLGTEIDLANGTLRTLEHWLRAGPSPTARLLAHCRETIDPAWGRAELPAPGLADIAAALEQGAPPEPRETTVADGWRRVPLLRELMAAEGASLFARLLARLIDLLACLDPREAPGETLPAAPGIGLARAARGLLAHRASVAGGIVTDYRVLSPSAWNLAPGGLLQRALDALPIGPHAPMLARLVVACVNPCVPVTLRLDAPEGRLHA